MHGALAELDGIGVILAAPGGTGKTTVQNAVPLKGMFFLSQAVGDRVEPVGPGHAVSLLVSCAEQTSSLMARGLSKEETRAQHLERFNNLCALARVVPTHILRISLNGTFWQEIEQTLEGEAIVKEHE